MEKKYILYSRKSTDREDRQIQSIEDQVNKMKSLAKNLNLKIVEIITESKSAKLPDNRPLFMQMVKSIESGKADAILCWQINRLSRNPIDSAKLQWLLQQKTLRSIQTIDKEYLPEDNVLLFSVESGIANQYLLDLSKNVLRGMRSKIEKGWRPSLAPIGYLNDKEERTVVKDPERFDVLRKMFELMLTGNYNPPQVLEIATKEWGFRSRKFKKKGGKELCRSAIYKIFTNLFYAGILDYKGVHFQGKHEAIISLDEYDTIQVLLGRKGKPRNRKHEFAFSGMIRCAECGCLYTPLEKTKVNKAMGKVKKYVYYYCNKKKKEIKCTQRKNLKQEVIEKQVEDLLSQITILPKFRDWALEILDRENEKEITSRTKIYEMQHKAVSETQNQIDNLTRMRIRDLLDDVEYLKEKAKLTSELNELKSKLRHTESRAEEWLELTEKTFNFATYARKAFVTGDLKIKKEIFAALGQNILAKDGRLELEFNEWLKPIQKDYPALEKEYRRLEPMKNDLSESENDKLSEIFEKWSG